MRERADWSYIQARLQARHGQRLTESDWLTLESSKSLGHYLERSRATSLRRFTDHLEAQMQSHAIERVLRAGWRDYVGEVAGWAPAAWRPAVQWTAYLSDLAVVRHLLDGHTPDWSRADPVYAPLAEADGQVRADQLAETPLRPLAQAEDRTASLGARWLAHWRALWPRLRQKDERSLDRLIERVARCTEQLRHADIEDRSGLFRADLIQAAIRMFRRHSGTSVAMFCSLILVASDLERLRGGLIRRSLFQTEPAREAA